MNNFMNKRNYEKLMSIGNIQGSIDALVEDNPDKLDNEYKDSDEEGMYETGIPTSR